jgi:transposase
MKTLNELEKASLEATLKKTKDLSEWKRIFAIVGYDDGQSIEELAEALRLSPITIETYLREYSSQDKTKNAPRGGSDSKLTAEQSHQLEQHLSEKTYLKVKHIVAYVEKQFQKKYSRSGMTFWLIEHGFVYKQPQKVPGKINPEEQAKFVAKYEELKESIGPKDEIYFADSVHPEYQSQAVCGWIKKGECKTLLTSGKQTRLHFTGAVCLSEMKIVINEYKTVDADAMIDFLKKLEEHSKAPKIHVILDNARAHKNKKVDEYLKSSRVELHYLPPYSPNLNSIERLWKILREKTTYNHYYPCFRNFSEAVRNFFDEKVPAMLDVLRERLTDKFQVIKLNPINIA